MNKNDLDALLIQIQNIIMNKPLSEGLKCKSEDLSDLQESISYLSSCLLESNAFLRALGEGNLDAPTPDRHNFLAGSLKDLHSSLKHLTWQADQVSKGDYSQQVHFLGDFSNSFNMMIQQLSEREHKLKQQSAVLTDSVVLMKAIMDGLKDWVIVCEKETDEIIYVNQSAQHSIFDLKVAQRLCDETYTFLEYLKNQKEQTSEFTCQISGKTLRTQTFLIQWSEKLAYVHYIQDVTDEQEYHEMAYRDELTGLHNRRYFFYILESYVQQNIDFCLCSLDLDGLKNANDHFGHLIGDEYLKTVAREINRISGKDATCCRIGGDEFAILLPRGEIQDLTEGMVLLNKTLTALSKGYPMSVSYGLVQVRGGEAVEIDTLLAKADAKMYTIKNSKKRTTK